MADCEFWKRLLGASRIGATLSRRHEGPDRRVVAIHRVDGNDVLYRRAVPTLEEEPLRRWPSSRRYSPHRSDSKNCVQRTLGRTAARAYVDGPQAAHS